MKPLLAIGFAITLAFGLEARAQSPVDDQQERLDAIFSQQRSDFQPRRDFEPDTRRAVLPRRILGVPLRGVNPDRIEQGAFRGSSSPGRER
ncbi:MAG: hypothetical protein AAGE80_15480 [Pseudomonadota bacterium]